MMAKLGEADAAWVAGDRSVFAASQAGDAELEAAAGFRLGHAFLSAGKLDQAELAVAAALRTLERASTAFSADGVALQGALHLELAIVAARRVDRSAAWAALTRARQVADQLVPGYVEGRFDTEFSAQNIAIHAVAVAAELGDAAEALRRWSDVDAWRLSPERRARLLVDVARAEAQRRKARAAVRALEEAERLAPEMVRCHWLARETVRDLLRRERGRAKAGRLGLASRMGLV